MAPRDWNADSYDSISAPQQLWGATVVARLELRGDETVVDAGAGTGLVTEILLERLPRGRVIAVDGSPSMAETARERLPADRATVIHADLLELDLPAPVDAIISTATFHWILDHDALFARMRALLVSGGQFVAQCGGEGNLDRGARPANSERERPPFAEHLATLRADLELREAEPSTRERLERRGLRGVRVLARKADAGDAAAPARVPRDRDLRALPDAPSRGAARPVSRRGHGERLRLGEQPGARLRAAQLGRDGAL